MQNRHLLCVRYTIFALVVLLSPIWAWLLFNILIYFNIITFCFHYLVLTWDVINRTLHIYTPKKKYRWDKIFAKIGNISWFRLKSRNSFGKCFHKISRDLLEVSNIYPQIQRIFKQGKAQPWIYRQQKLNTLPTEITLR